MTERARPRLPKWPFFLGDLLLLGVAGLVLWQSRRPLPVDAMGLLAACVAIGAALGALPFVLQYRHESRLAQVGALDTALLRVQNIEIVGRQIASATSNWQAVQDDATRAVAAAREINNAMTGEARAFQEFLTKANDAERSHLRLEVEKLMRAEADWVRVLIRVLDHVHALFLAGVRSGQPALVDQLTSFQRACRDAALRVGLVPFEPRAGDKFDEQLHERAHPNGDLPPDALVSDTVATGYRFQGQLARRALVALQGERAEPSPLSIRQIKQRRDQTQPAAAATPREVPSDPAERDAVESTPAPCPAAAPEPAGSPEAPA